SFGGSKLLTAGRGGALLTNRADVNQRLRLLLQRGNNLPMPLSELQAVVLEPQIDKLSERTRRRAASVECLRPHLSEIAGLRLLSGPMEDTTAAFYKVGMQLDAAQFGLSRDRAAAALRAEGIAIDAGFPALHVGRSAARYKRTGSLTEAEKAHRECLVLHHPV